MREFTIGDHRSVFHGTGFDFVGLRDWQPGDRLASIDWPQSTITNFSPLVVRDFAQPSTAGVVAVAYVSPSTLCGIDGVPLAVAIARAIGTIGTSAVFFQDTFGLITSTRFQESVSCGRESAKLKSTASMPINIIAGCRRRRPTLERIAGYIRKPSLSRHLRLCSTTRNRDRGATQLNSTHDVVLVVIDSASLRCRRCRMGGGLRRRDRPVARARKDAMRARSAAGMAGRGASDGRRPI